MDWIYGKLILPLMLGELGRLRHLLILLHHKDQMRVCSITLNVLKKFIPIIFLFLDEILLIKQQLRQKEVIDCELRKEKEKLETIKLEIISMMQPVLSTVNIEMLKQDIVRLRCACERLTQELDAAGVPSKILIHLRFETNLTHPLFSFR